MIFGIGTDIVEISRMKENLAKHGNRFANRILAQNEMIEFEQSSSQSAFLAKRFAAKEAAVKALGTGFRNGISMTHISVEHDALGKPVLQLTDAALTVADELKITETYISIADEKEYAVAYVIMEYSKS